MANTIAEQSETKGKVVGAVAVTGIVAGVTGGVGLYLGAATLPATVTTLGLTEAGAATATTLGTAAATNPDKTAQLIEAVTIQFGKGANQISHAFRHTDKLGLNRVDVQTAIENDLRGAASQIQAGAPVIPRIVQVGGQMIRYNPFKMADGTINVGRIHEIK